MIGGIKANALLYNYKVWCMNPMNIMMLSYDPSVMMRGIQ